MMVLLRLLKWLLALFDVFSSKLLLSSQRHNNNSRQPAAQPTEISTLEYIHFTIIIHIILLEYVRVWTETLGPSGGPRLSGSLGPSSTALSSRP